MTSDEILSRLRRHSVNREVTAAVEALIDEAKRLRHTIELLAAGEIHVEEGWNEARQQHAFWAYRSEVFYGPHDTRIDAAMAADAAEEIG